MKIILNLTAAACLLLLAGCACPRPEGVHSTTPYGEEGTAGYGLVDNGCWRRTFD